MFFSFAKPLLNVGYERALAVDDLPEVPRRDAAAAQVERLDAAWRAEQAAAALRGGGDAGTPSLWRALYAANRGPFAIALVNAFLESAFCIGQPVLLRYIVAWLQQPSSVGAGLGWAAALTL